MNDNIPSKTEIESSILGLFNRTKEIDRIVLWRACIPTDPVLDKHAAKEGKRGVTYGPLYEWQELKLFIWSFEELLKRSSNDLDLQVRIMMILYCHIFEADFPFAVIWNLMRAINGQRESWTFIGQDKKGDPLVCEYPSQKIREIKRISDEIGLNIGNVINDLWNDNLRNSFSHSQYCISDDEILFTKNLSPISRIPPDNMPRIANLQINELKKLYDGVHTLFEVFDQEYKNVFEYVTSQNQRLHKGRS
jgi:hypothetical protein